MPRCFRRGVGSLCMIVDGMDQANFNIPPSCSCCEVLDRDAPPQDTSLGSDGPHGWHKQCYMIQPHLRHDSNMTLMSFWSVTGPIALGLAASFSTRRTQEIIKIYLFLRWPKAMIASHMFDVIALQYLRSGHSHEDIDALFGVWATHLSHQDTLETPSVVTSDCEFQVVGASRQWQEYSENLACKEIGISNSDAEGTAHSFLFLRRGPGVMKIARRSCGETS